MKPAEVEMHVQYTFRVRGKEFGFILRALRRLEASPQAKELVLYMEKQRLKQASDYVRQLEADASEALAEPSRSPEPRTEEGGEI